MAITHEIPCQSYVRSSDHIWIAHQITSQIPSQSHDMSHSNHTSDRQIKCRSHVRGTPYCSFTSRQYTAGAQQTACINLQEPYAVYTPLALHDQTLCMLVTCVPRISSATTPATASSAIALTRVSPLTAQTSIRLSHRNMLACGVTPVSRLGSAASVRCYKSVTPGQQLQRGGRF
jgi:hypothetical protein